MTQNEKRTATPTVTIGMPVFNGEKYIREALDSVLAQTYQDFELIISDNASNDKTQAICIDYSERDARVKYFRQHQNLGGHWNFNFVAQTAKGPLFTWLAHDDILEPNFLEESVEYMSRRSNTVLVVGDFKIIDGDGMELGIEKLEKIRGHVEWNKRCVEFFKYPISNVLFCIYGMMKSDTCKWVSQSVPAPKLLGGSEAPILTRFAVAGEIASIPTVLRQYRRHAASVCTSEAAELSKISIFYRSAIRIKSLCGRRFDQLRVLLCSDLPTRTKISLIIRILFWYMTEFGSRIKRVWARLLRIV